MNSDVLNDGATSLSYPAEQVRKFDHDRFMSAIAAPAAARENLFALYAFNIEIAKVSEVVTEPLIGRMRLQWWRDTLDRLYAGEAVAHQVAQPLGLAIASAKLDRRQFDRLIDAREFDIDRTPPANFAALKSYAEGTGAPLLALGLRIAGAGQGAAEEVAALAGTAWALTGLLRAVPFHARQRRLYLPADRLIEHSVRIQGLLDLKPAPGLAQVVREISEYAGELLDAVPRTIATVPKAARSPALIVALARYYLADLRRSGWDPFVLERRKPRPMTIARLGLRALTKGY